MKFKIGDYVVINTSPDIYDMFWNTEGIIQSFVDYSNRKAARIYIDQFKNSYDFGLDMFSLKKKIRWTYGI